MIAELRPKYGSTEPDVDTFGELADNLAGALWRMARGEPDVRDEDLLQRGETVLSSIADELNEPYLARPRIALSDALLFSDVGNDERALEVQRAAASAFFRQLSEAISQLRSQRADAPAAGELAEVFALIGASASETYRSDAPSSRTWAKA